MILFFSKFSPTFNLRLNLLYTFISYLLRGEVLDEKHELDLQTPHSIISFVRRSVADT